MRTLSLFSGIGGMDLGLERAGFQIVGQCEQDPFCRAVLAKHWPGVPCFDDVRTIDPDAVGQVECVCGGFPCQDVSVAGKGAGVEKGERSGLWREMHRVIKAIGPCWVVAENVPALRTRGADRVLRDLEEIGYASWPIVVGAEHVGAPHRRHRVFIVAYADGVGRADQGHRRIPKHAHARVSRKDRWPARPGRPQEAWEPKRYLQLPLGGFIDGIPARLVRAANRHALRGYGNAVVAQVAELVGAAVKAADQALRGAHA